MSGDNIRYFKTPMDLCQGTTLDKKKQMSRRTRRRESQSSTIESVTQTFDDVWQERQALALRKVGSTRRMRETRHGNHYSARNPTLTSRLCHVTI